MPVEQPPPPEADAVPDAVAPRSGADRRNQRVLERIAAVALAAAPGLVVAVALLAQYRSGRWYPVSDLAQAELRMQAFWGNPPLLGAAGRIGPLLQQGAHPGPAAWWFAEPFYRVFGRGSWAALAASGALTAVWAAAAITVVRRRAGWGPAVVTTVLVLGLFRAWGPEVWTEPWNPWLGVTAFVALVPLVWAATDGMRGALAGAALVGTFSIQAHAGYLPVVTALGAVAVVGVLLTARRTRRVRAAVSEVALALAVTAVMWIPTAIEQATNHPGNLVILWRHFTNPPEAAIGVGGGLRLVAGSVNLRGLWWLRDGAPPLQRSVALGAAGFVALWAAAVVLAWRARRPEILRLHAVVAVGVAAGVVAASRIFGTVFDYLTPWLPVLAAFVVLAVVWSIGAALHHRRASLSVDAAMAGAAVPAVRRFGPLLVFVTLGAVLPTATEAVPPGGRQSRIMAEVSGALVDLPRGPRYLVRWIDPVALGAVGFGTVLELRRSGHEAFGLQVFRTALLPHNVGEPASADRAVVIVSGPATRAWADLPGVERLIEIDPRTPEEAAESERLTASLVAALRPVAPDLAELLPSNYWAAIIDPRTPAELQPRLERLRDIGLPVSVFLAPPTVEPPVAPPPDGGTAPATSGG